MAVQNWVVDADLGRIRPNHEFTVKMEPSQNGSQSIPSNDTSFTWSVPLMTTVSSAGDVKMDTGQSTNSTIYQSNTQSLAAAVQSQPVTSVYADSRMVATDASSWHQPPGGLQNAVPFTPSHQGTTVQPFAHRPGFEIPRSGPLPAVSHFLGNSVGQFPSGATVVPYYSQSSNNFPGALPQGGFPPPTYQILSVENAAELCQNQGKHNVHEVKQLQDYMTYAPPRLSSSEHSSDVMSLPQTAPPLSIAQGTLYQQHAVHSSAVSSQPTATTSAESHAPSTNSSGGETTAGSHGHTVTAQWEEDKRQIRQWLQTEHHGNSVEQAHPQPVSFANVHLNQGAIFTSSPVNGTPVMQPVNGNGSAQNNSHLAARPVCNQTADAALSSQWSLGTDQVDGNVTCYSTAATLVQQATLSSATSGQAIWGIHDRDGAPSTVKRIKTEADEPYTNNQPYMFQSVQLQTATSCPTTVLPHFPNAGSNTLREGSQNSTSSEYATLTNVPLFTDVNPQNANNSNRSSETAHAHSTAVSHAPSSIPNATNFQAGVTMPRTSSLPTIGTARAPMQFSQTYTVSSAPTSHSKRKLPQNVSCINNLNLDNNGIGMAGNTLTIHSRDSDAVKGIPVLSIVSVGPKTVIEYKRAQEKSTSMHITTVKPSVAAENNEVPGVVARADHPEKRKGPAVGIQDSRVGLPPVEKPKTVRTLLDERLPVPQNRASETNQVGEECTTDQNRNNSSACQYCPEVFSSWTAALEHEKLHHDNMVLPTPHQVKTRPECDTGPRATNPQKSAGSQHRKLSDLIVKLKAMRRDEECSGKASGGGIRKGKGKRKKMRAQHCASDQSSLRLDTFQETSPCDQVVIKSEPETPGYEEAGDANAAMCRLSKRLGQGGVLCSEMNKNSTTNTGTVQSGLNTVTFGDHAGHEEQKMRSVNLKKENTASGCFAMECSDNSSCRTIDDRSFRALDVESVGRLSCDSECPVSQSSNVDNFCAQAGQTTSCVGQVSDGRHSNLSGTKRPDLNRSSALTVHSASDRSIRGLPVFSIVSVDGKGQDHHIEFVGIHGQGFPSRTSGGALVHGAEPMETQQSRDDRRGLTELPPTTTVQKSDAQTLSPRITASEPGKPKATDPSCIVSMTASLCGITRDAVCRTEPEPCVTESNSSMTEPTHGPRKELEATTRQHSPRLSTAHPPRSTVYKACAVGIADSDRRRTETTRTYSTTNTSAHHQAKRDQSDNAAMSRPSHSTTATSNSVATPTSAVSTISTSKVCDYGMTVHKANDASIKGIPVYAILSMDDREKQPCFEFVGIHGQNPGDKDYHKHTGIR